MSGYRIIHVEFIYPPIPIRTHDYQATFEGYEPGDPIGHGPTEAAAIADLFEEYESDLEYAEWRRSVRENSKVPF